MNLASALFLLLALTFPGPAHSQALPSPLPKLPQNYLPLMLIPQSTTYSCGAAALMSVLEYWDRYEGNESQLFAPLRTTPRNGTQPVSMSNLARKYGLRSEIRTGMTLSDLRASLKDGMTVIIDLQAWAEKPISDWKNTWEEGHYVVLVGMDDAYVYFMDPSAHGAYAYLSHTELLERWHDYDFLNGRHQRYERLGILIHGTNARSRFPGALLKIQ